MTQIITNSLPMGVPGDLSRQQATVESFNNSTTVPVTVFGRPVKAGAQANSVTGFAGGEAGAACIGFLVRDYPSQGGLSSNEAFGAGTPPVSGPVGVLREGYMVVRVDSTSVPANGGGVYVRIAAATGPKPLGGLEAAADGANSVLIPNCTFTGPKDAENNVEIRFNVGNSI